MQVSKTYELFVTIITHSCPIAGVYVLESDVKADDRGSFLRSFCAREFAALQLPAHFPQHNLSTNVRKGTLRGLHYQSGVPEEYKLVRCVSGKVWDVVADIRRDSPTFGKWWGKELAGDGREAIFIPAGCAHGFVTLVPDSTLYYLMGCEYREGDQKGIRFDDPDLNIEWPFKPEFISERDRSLPHFKEAV